MEEPMRNIVYIGDRSCKSCKFYKETVIEPLMERYPNNVEVHVGYDAKIAEADARKKITHVPTVVVESDGREEFRFSAFLKLGELEDIINCNADASAFEGVLV